MAYVLTHTSSDIYDEWTCGVRSWKEPFAHWIHVKPVGATHRKTR